MAGQTPPLSPALHPHLGFLAQSGRALLRPDHSAAHPARFLHLGRRTRNRHSRLPRTPQCTPQALHLDQICRRNPRKGHPRAKRPRTSTCRESTVKSTTLALGSALATIGLTIPAVAAVSIVLGTPLTLGVGSKERSIRRT